MTLMNHAMKIRDEPSKSDHAQQESLVQLGLDNSPLNTNRTPTNKPHEEYLGRARTRKNLFGNREPRILVEKHQHSPIPQKMLKLGLESEQCDVANLADFDSESVCSR